MKRSTLVLAVLALVLGGVGQAKAGFITYDDRTTFLTATQSSQTITFESQNTTPPFTYYGSAGLSVSGVQFSAPLSHYLYVADGNAVYPAYDWGSVASLLFGSTNEGGNLVISLPMGITAFGLDFMAESDTLSDTGVAAPFTFTVNGTNVYSATSMLRPNRAFFGLTSDSPITSLTITMTNPSPDRSLPIIDNVSFGQASISAVPEPSSLALSGMAIASFAGYFGWRRRKLAAP